METVILQRLTTGDQGTFGELRVGAKTWKTCELPWRDNARGKSCIPAGVYLCRWRKSPRLSARAGFDVFKYEITDVPGRDGVLVHSGNFGGDADKGWESQIKGCVLPGRRTVEMKNAYGNMQMAVANSREATKEFEDTMAQADFMLDVRDVASYAHVGA